MLDQDQLDRIANTAERAAQRARPTNTEHQATHSFIIKGSPGRDINIGNAGTGRLSSIALVAALLIILMLLGALFDRPPAGYASTAFSNAHLSAVNAVLILVSICKPSVGRADFDAISQTFLMRARYLSDGRKVALLLDSVPFQTVLSRLIPVSPTKSPRTTKRITDTTIPAL